MLHALSLSPIPFYGTRHESSASMMAAAAFAATGRMAAALGEMGPGGLNLAAGAGVAFNNNLAALFITTNQHRAAAYPHQGMFMDLDTRAVFAPLTKWNAVVHDPRRMPELVRTAFREALSGRPGPVHLDIPQDVLSATATWRADEFDLAPARYRATAGPRPAAETVAAAAALLKGARAARSSSLAAASFTPAPRAHCANWPHGCRPRWCLRRWRWASSPAITRPSSATAA